MTTPRKLRRCRVVLPVGNRQQPLLPLSTSYAGGTFAASARARATRAAGARRDWLSRANAFRGLPQGWGYATGKGIVGPVWTGQP